MSSILTGIIDLGVEIFPVNCSALQSAKVIDGEYEKYRDKGLKKVNSQF